MENKRPLLSICIPTYNRAEYLKGALDNITSDAAFDERVEIIVSDNASTDETEIIANEFVKQYPNIVYYKNIENIKDKNFMLALSRGRGKYVRLFNDTLRFKEGALQIMLEQISVSSEAEALFFYQNVSIVNSVNTQYTIKGINNFLSKTTYYITWIANFGCWKSKVLQVNEPDRCASMQLSQVDWTLQIVQTAQNVKICFGDYFTSITPQRKGGYNIFEVFVENYLSILKEYKMSFIPYEREKWLLMRYFLFPWCIKISTDKTLTFSSDKKWKILFKHYALLPYFYFLFLYIEIKSNRREN